MHHGITRTELLCLSTIASADAFPFIFYNNRNKTAGWRRLSEVRRSHHSTKNNEHEMDYNEISFARRLLINAGRVGDNALRPPHYNPLTINELLMKWNGRRCPTDRQEAPKRADRYDLHRRTETFGDRMRPPILPFSNSLSLDRYHPSRN